LLPSEELFLGPAEGEGKILDNRSADVEKASKGAFDRILEICTCAARSDGTSIPIGELRPELERRFSELSERGLRVLGVARRELSGEEPIGTAS
jgi:magnesium-transporting ATPase (P-type)